jgi:hypothetical protein
MKVFLSWSGEPSRALAEALRDWLPLVLHYVEPWMSEVDIDAGDRWADSVAKELEACNFGVICVTRENVGSPWILFEAGALAKSMNGSRVIPLLLDIDFRDISGPLAQFQAKKVERAGVGEVVQSINQASDSPDDQSRASQLFDALWPQLESSVAQISTDAEPAKRSRPQAEVLEELVASVRALDARFRDVSEMGMASRRHPRRRREPLMLAEIGHMAATRPNDPTSLLMLAAGFRDSAPWLYDLVTDAYRAAIEDPRRAGEAAERLYRVLEVIDHGPFPAEELDVDPRALSVLSREVSRLMPYAPSAPEPEEANEAGEEDDGDGDGDDSDD